MPAAQLKFKTYPGWKIIRDDATGLYRCNENRSFVIFRDLDGVFRVHTHYGKPVFYRKHGFNPFKPPYWKPPENWRLPKEKWTKPDKMPTHALEIEEI